MERFTAPSFQRSHEHLQVRFPNGIQQKKKGGKGTIGKVGIGFLMVPLLILLFVGGSYIWRKAAIKCVADEWRYTSINAGEGSAVRNMLRSLLVSVDDGDIETFRREFAQDIQDDDSHHGKYRYDIGYVYNSKIDGQTYYIYVRVCTRDDQHRDGIGLEQFIICTEDKVDELYEIIDDRDDDNYLDVL